MAEKRQPAGRLLEGSAMRREDQAQHSLPVSCDEKPTLPASRRAFDRSEDAGRNRTDPARCDEAQQILEGGDPRTAKRSKAASAGTHAAGLDQLRGFQRVGRNSDWGKFLLSIPCLSHIDIWCSVRKSTSVFFERNPIAKYNCFAEHEGRRR